MKKSLFLGFISVLIIVALSNCKKEDKIVMPDVTTESASMVSQNSAMLNGFVNEEGGSAVTGRGFCYSAIPGADMNDSLVSSGSGPGHFTVQISGLHSGRIYYYKVYATSEKGTALGEEKSFTTKEDTASIPTVITDTATMVSHNSAILNGSVNEEGGSAVTVRGFCISTNPGPELDDTIVSSGFGPGEFSEEISILQPDKTYYYRAFATNAVGTSFGQEQSFTTNAEPDPGPMLLLIEDFGYTFNDVTLSTGSTIKIGVVGSQSIVSGNMLTRFKFTYTLNNIETPLFDSIFNSDSFNWEADLTFAQPGSGRLYFELTDFGNMKATRSFLVTVQSPENVKYSNVELGSWNDQTGSFFSTSEGIIYTITQTMNVPANQAKIDFLFFKGVTNGNTIASPDDTDANMILEYKLNLWTNKNQTRFNTTNITAAQFDAIGASYEFPEFEISSQMTKASQLVEGNVILFKRQSGKLGLIKIVDLYTKGDKMKIDVVIEK
ncbi:MAG: hypothetical protein AB9834_24475 [Lentimicrobium sp.]